MQPPTVRFRLGGVPAAELLVHGVAEDDFENVQGFVDGAGEVDVPPAEADGVLQGPSDVICD
jgi:hypothetical protein